MAATTVACDREKKSHTNPPSFPAKKRVGFSVPGSRNPSSLPLIFPRRNYSFQCSKRVVPSQPQTPLKVLFYFWFGLVFAFGQEKGGYDPTFHLRTHTRRERERERERAVDFGGEIIGPDDL
ncbi:unnamed protein product [Camellia sinensis]